MKKETLLSRREFLNKARRRRRVRRGAPLLEGVPGHAAEPSPRRGSECVWRQSPNIILVMTDDQAGPDTGYSSANNPERPSPHSTMTPWRRVFG